MIKWFSTFIYVIPENYESWLENLALKGFHPKKITQWSSVLMKFYKGESKKYKYVLDMQAFPRDNYKETYEEFG